MAKQEGVRGENQSSRRKEVVRTNGLMTGRIKKDIHPVCQDRRGALVTASVRNSLIQVLSNLCASVHFFGRGEDNNINNNKNTVCSS